MTSGLLSVIVVLPHMSGYWKDTTISEMFLNIAVKKVNLIKRANSYEVILFQRYSDRISIPHDLYSHKEQARFDRVTDKNVTDINFLSRLKTC